MPEIEEGQSLLAVLDETGAVKAEAARRERRLKLQTAYGEAVTWAKGFASEETRAAYTIAAQLAEQGGSEDERFQVQYAEILRTFMRNEVRTARTLGEALLLEARAKGRAMETALARRGLGYICLLQGELGTSRDHLEWVLQQLTPEQDRESTRLFGVPMGIATRLYFSEASWLLGEVDSARRLLEQAVRAGQDSKSVVTRTFVSSHETILEGYRDDPASVRRVAGAANEFCRESGVAAFPALLQLYLGWARGRLGEPEAGLQDLREGLQAYFDTGSRSGAPYFYGLAAELEALAGRPDNALEAIEAAFADARESGACWADPFLYRHKGRILLQRDPSDPAAAEAAFRTAFDMARAQGARSFGLRAALSLAKLYDSTGRPVEAHAVLEPALEGFAPTPEMPEIAEARALVGRLS